MESTNSRK